MLWERMDMNQNLADILDVCAHYYLIDCELGSDYWTDVCFAIQKQTDSTTNHEMTAIKLRNKLRTKNTACFIHAKTDALSAAQFWVSSKLLSFRFDSS